MRNRDKKYHDIDPPCGFNGKKDRRKHNKAESKGYIKWIQRAKCRIADEIKDKCAA
ncbi:hypothetical protein [Candidatus Magnetominusculus dajiuhuensis]|uniref:hypothetical protein n=1 Tax=Candidatus Magnetominusculus dajiuhuensis TaxID=3137712 RepID=UPI003B430B8A